ncbi:MAG: hypothetical protein ACSLEZ_06635 [Thiobacillus sp.]
MAVHAMPRDIAFGKTAGLSDDMTQPIKKASFIESVDHGLPGCAEKKV